MNDKEIWLDVPGFEDSYEISNYGELRSKTRIRSNSAKSARIIHGQMITPYKRKDGYLTVRIALHGKKTSTYIHKLVALAFHGSPKDYQEILHKNGIKTDNRAENIHWGTRKQNIADNFLHGKAAIGEKHGRSKLSEKSIISIRNDTRKPKEIAFDFNVSVALIYKIKKRELWKHLD